VTVNGGSTVEGSISSIEAGETETVTIPLTPAPSGQVTLEVDVQPVPGEQVADNNRASYTVNLQ
jgi:subtilase family serine protease